uniref:Uncharacterized protein n=1 Tax=Rhizophora mucronata TaxID=61149 RepID=A0A2P2K739_RHIMU
MELVLKFYKDLEFWVSI